jgi:hypothetical protein
MKWYTIREIIRENQGSAFGVWKGLPRTVFGLRPLAIFETYAEARAYAESMK